MDKKEYQRNYMRKYRASHSQKKKEEIRKRDNEYKKRKRRTDPEWLKAERARRRKYGKVNRNRNKEKDKKVRNQYHSRYPERVKARRMLGIAVRAGIVNRPEACEKCGEVPKPLRDRRAKTGYRHPLRADHHKGYRAKNWLNVLWICIDCDGRQLRSKKQLVDD